MLKSRKNVWPLYWRWNVSISNTFGRRTIVHSDHKPLEMIVKKPLHEAPRRLQGMASSHAAVRHWSHIPQRERDAYCRYTLKEHTCHTVEVLTTSVLWMQWDIYQSAQNACKCSRRAYTGTIHCRCWNMWYSEVGQSGDMRYQPVSMHTSAWELNLLSAMDWYSAENELLFLRECGNSRRNVSTDHTWELKVYYEEHDNVCTGRTWQQTSDKSLRTARRADCMRGRYRKKPHETPTLQREKVGVDLFSWEGRDYQVVVDYTSYTDPYLALLEIKNTPTQGLGSSPAQRLLNRRTRTLLPMSSKLLAPRGEEYLNQDRIRLKDLQRTTGQTLQQDSQGSVRLRRRRCGPNEAVSSRTKGMGKGCCAKTTGWAFVWGRYTSGDIQAQSSASTGEHVRQRRQYQLCQSCHMICNAMQLFLSRQIARPWTRQRSTANRRSSDDQPDRRKDLRVWRTMFTTDCNVKTRIVNWTVQDRGLTLNNNFDLIGHFTWKEEHLT